MVSKCAGEFNSYILYSPNSSSVGLPNLKKMVPSCSFQSKGKYFPLTVIPHFLSFGCLQLKDAQNMRVTHMMSIADVSRLINQRTQSRID